MTAYDIAVLGSSATGISLAIACVEAGLHAVICEPDFHARDRAKTFALIDSSEIAKKITFVDTYQPAESASFLFDARDPEERGRVEIAPVPSAVIATPFADPPGFGPPSQTVRFVPFQPMHLRRLTELMRFPGTSHKAMAEAKTFAENIGRVAIILPRNTRSVGLRLLDSLCQAADQLLLEGAILWEVDDILTRFGFGLGHYEAQDLIGLDVNYSRRKAQGTPSLIADRAVEEGRIGKKIGWGWYRYPGGGGAVIDPLIEDLIREEAWFAKTPQRSFSDEEILDRILQSLRNETNAVLAERQVNNPADLSQILVHGLGYPSDRLRDLALPPPADQRGSGAG